MLEIWNFDFLSFIYTWKSNVMKKQKKKHFEEHWKHYSPQMTIQWPNQLTVLLVRNRFRLSFIKIQTNSQMMRNGMCIVTSVCGGFWIVSATHFQELNLFIVWPIFLCKSISSRFFPSFSQLSIENFQFVANNLWLCEMAQLSKSGSSISLIHHGEEMKKKIEELIKLKNMNQLSKWRDIM